jgi:hypothetical protein
VALKQALAAAGSLTISLNFTLSTPFPVDASRITDFSSAGPSVDIGIKPDLVAVGQDMYMATQTFDPNGDMYDPSGYTLADGSSFSTPMVAGCLALVKAARPQLTVAQYRSLVINNSASISSWTGGPASVQQVGAGVLDCGAALRGTTAASPTSLSYGAGGPDLQTTRTLTVTNLGATPDTFSVVATPSADPAGPVPARNTVQLAPGASADIALAWQAGGLAPGAHEGLIRVTGAASGNEIRIPYWYGVTSNTPARITVLQSSPSGRRGSLQQNAIQFRVTDSAGMAILGVPAQVTVLTGGGSAQSPVSRDSAYPGVYGVSVRLGLVAGDNTFRIQAGSLTADVSITGQ